MSSYHIAIEGTIGVGKTSLAHLLANESDAKLVLEQFEDNPFLSSFYQDTNNYAFQTQLWFLLTRNKQQQELQQLDLFTTCIISDYMFVKDRLFAALNLNENEMQLYNMVAKELEKNVIYPDLVIFLQSDTERLIENIKSRGRKYEQNVDWNYIDALNQVYTEYFFRYQDTPLVIINTDNIDFVENEKDLKEVIDYIRQPVSGTKFFNPVSEF